MSVTPRAPLGGKPARSPHLRLDVNMILVPVTVTDETDRPVMGLAPGSFRLFEDNVEQKIATFFREEGPVSVGFLFDCSASMKKKMDRSVAAIEQFLKTATPDDEYFLIRFNDQPVVAEPIHSRYERYLERTLVCTAGGMDRAE